MMRRSSRRGGAAVEFALTLPVLLFIFLAAIEYGWLFTQQNWINNSVRDTTRYVATLDPAVTDVESEAEVRLEQLLEGGFGYNCATQCEIEAKYQARGYDSEYDVIRLETDVVYNELGGLVPVPSHLHSDMTMIMVNVPR